MLCRRKSKPTLLRAITSWSGASRGCLSISFQYNTSGSRIPPGNLLLPRDSNAIIL
jgi:hypothetical protein